MPGSKTISPYKKRMEYAELLKPYLEDLASGKPAPGGGSAAALVGALAASLVCMVANFTVGKEKYREFEEEARDVLREAEEIKYALLRLADEDVKAYQSYVQARSLPKNTAGEKEERKQAIGKAILRATQVPLHVMEKSLRILELNKALLGRSNPYLVSDIGVSAEFAHASLNSACFNVQINLPYLEESTRRKIREKVKFIREKDSSLYQEVVAEARRGVGDFRL